MNIAQRLLFQADPTIAETLTRLLRERPEVQASVLLSEAGLHSERFPERLQGGGEQYARS